MPDKKEIGQRLKELRGLKSAGTVAKALGISRSAVSMWESGKRVPTDEMKIKLACYFGVTVQSLFYD